MRAVVPVTALLALCACPAPEGGDAPPAAPTSAPEVPATAPASGPSAQGTTPDRRNDVDADGVVRRGVEVAPEEAMTVAALMTSAPELAGETVTVTGEVTEVCAKKGCWMALRGEEGGPTVRVTSKGYAYFVPEDATGMVATVKGELSVRVLDEATAKHYAEESGRAMAADAVGGRELAIASVGLELVRR